MLRLRARLLPIALVVAVIVMVFLAFRLGTTSEQIGQNQQRIEAQNDILAGRTPAP